MKRCPFCAEEIQDAAIVCRYCQRDLTAHAPGAAPPPAPAAPAIARAFGGRKWVGIVLGLLVVLGLIAGAVKLLAPSRSGATSPQGAVGQNPPQGAGSPTAADAARPTTAEKPAPQITAEEPALQVSAERGRLGFDFINREPSALSQCRATITDAQGTTWIAYVTTIVAPTEKATVWWNDFRHEGQELPAEFGRAFSITLSCVVDSAGQRHRTRLWR